MGRVTLDSGAARGELSALAGGVAGPQLALGSTWSETSRTSRCTRRNATAAWALPLRRRRRGGHRLTERGARHLARRPARRRAGHRYGYRVAGTADPSRACGSTPTSCCRPVRPGGVGRGHRWTRPSRVRRGRPGPHERVGLGAVRAAGRGRRRPLRLATTARTGTAGATPSSRDARQGRPPSTTGCPRSCAARTPDWRRRRWSTTSRTSGSPRSSCCSPPVRLRAGAGRQGSPTSGATARSATSPPQRAYSASGDRGRQVTEFGDGEGLPRRGLEVIDVVCQPTAEAGVEADSSRSRPGRPGLLPGERRRLRRSLPGHLLGRDRVRHTVDASDPFALRLILDSCAGSPGCVDGFRFDLMSRSPRCTTGSTWLPPAHGDRPGPDPAAREADRGAVGRLDGRLPRGRVPPPWVEWNDQYRDGSATSGATTPLASAASPLGWRAPPTSTSTTGGRRTRRSLPSPPRRLPARPGLCPHEQKQRGQRGDNRDGTRDNKVLEPRRRGQGRPGCSGGARRQAVT